MWMVSSRSDSRPCSRKSRKSMPRVGAVVLVVMGILMATTEIIIAAAVAVDVAVHSACIAAATVVVGAAIAVVVCAVAVAVPASPVLVVVARNIRRRGRSCPHGVLLTVCPPYAH